MSKKSKKKKMKAKSATGIIEGKSLIIHSAGKRSKHENEVRTGTGSHKSKKKYDRKNKNNQQLRKTFKEYGQSGADFFIAS